MIGVPIGSRILITTPAQTSAGATTGLAIVADIIARAGPSKSLVTGITNDHMSNA